MPDIEIISQINLLIQQDLRKLSNIGRMDEKRSILHIFNPLTFLYQGDFKMQDISPHNIKDTFFWQNVTSRKKKILSDGRLRRHTQGQPRFSSSLASESCVSLFKREGTCELKTSADRRKYAKDSFNSLQTGRHV